jgi:prepilin-type N-terminal cleavage/methylation domain-containing protein
MGTKGKGFTLVELLVVISIIGILLAISIPVYGRAKATARRNKCMTQLHAVANAIRMYRDDWGAFPNVTMRDSTVLPPPDPTSKNDLGAVVSLYVNADLDDNAVLRCPDDTVGPTNDPLYTSYNSWTNPTSTHGDKIDQLYNWYGYDANSAGLESLADAGATYNIVTDALGRAMWVGYVDASTPGTWTGVFRGLCNANAPDGTVITHCPYHRANYRTDTMLDVVAFLGGNVEIKRVARFNWVAQQNQ